MLRSPDDLGGRTTSAAERERRCWPRLVALLIGLSAALSHAHGPASVVASKSSLIDRTVELDGGRRIALHCDGDGAYTVLLETGDGGHRRHLAALFDVLSTRYRVCAYDRRNVGRSSAAPLPRRAADLSADVFDALASVGADGPYILFGTSMGGLLVRSYAATREVAGFVTSNQPGTMREWGPRAHRHMSPADRAADLAWAAGDNLEHIDVNDLSRTIDAARPPTVPYVVMVSTERFQCPAAGTCGAMYGAFVAASRQAAAEGPQGRFRLLDGDHDLYVTDLGAVVAAIDEVSSAASAQRERGRHAPVARAP